MPLKDQKENVYRFLLENREKRFSCKEISEKTGIAYPTVIKWVEVLHAEGKINLINYGNLKQVWVGEANE